MRKYRFGGKDSSTQWRAVPLDGIVMPSRQERRFLGENFNLEIRGGLQETAAAEPNTPTPEDSQ